MNLKLKRTPGVYLVGFLASGKSTVGRHLAHRLGWSFYDTDREIEAAERLTIMEFVSTRGEPEFRRIETEIIRQHVRWIERGRPAVLALGCGAFVEPASRQLVQDNGMAVWLDCPLEVVMRRVGWGADGPLAQGPQKLAALFDARREAYSRADIHIPIESDDPEITVAAIVLHPLFQ
jgi:shikimate kinase